MATVNRLLDWVAGSDIHPLSVKMVASVLSESEKEKPTLRLAEHSCPRSPEEIEQCISLVDAADSHHRVAELSVVNPEWCYLVDRWPELYRHFLDHDITEIGVIHKNMVKAGSAAKKIMKNALAS